MKEGILNNLLKTYKCILDFVFSFPIYNKSNIQKRCRV